MREVSRILIPSHSEFTYISLVKDLERALSLNISDGLAPPLPVFVSTEILGWRNRLSAELFHVVPLPASKHAKILKRLSPSDHDKLRFWCSSPQGTPLSDHPLVVPLRNRKEYFARKYNASFDSHALVMLELCSAISLHLRVSG